MFEQAVYKFEIVTVTLCRNDGHKSVCNTSQLAKRHVVLVVNILSHVNLIQWQGNQYLNIPVF